jgi:hypothetical protein
MRVISFSRFKPFADKEACHSSPETPPTVHVAQNKNYGLQGAHKKCTAVLSVALFLQRGAVAVWRADFFPIVSSTYAASSLCGQTSPRWKKIFIEIYVFSSAVKSQKILIIDMWWWLHQNKYNLQEIASTTIEIQNVNKYANFNLHVS